MKKKILMSVVIICFSLLFFLNFSKKESIKLNDNKFETITFAYVVDGEKQTSIPTKGEYSFDTEKSFCTNGVNIFWDYYNWNASINNLKNTKSNCTLYFKKEYAEEILQGALPEIKNDLIPVTIDDHGVVRKADLSSNWYSYENKQWANAVILLDKTKEYKNNEEIKEENIESYFVWIPRYRYQLKESEETYNKYMEVKNIGIIQDSSFIKNLGQDSPYEIIFESKNTLRTEDNQNKWLSHPAFDSFNSNGFWVGKFETGYNQNENVNALINNVDNWTVEGAQKNVKDSSKIIIKPNVYSWRWNTIANDFYTSYDYKRELESHMMKNIEWGAIFYLTYSQYGRCEKNTCTEVRVNNVRFVTGNSANFIPSCEWSGKNLDCNKYDISIKSGLDGEISWNYFNPQSIAASTTGNYSGIYDMAGGVWEHVMGFLESSLENKKPASGYSKEFNSGFNGPYTCTECEDMGLEKTDGYDWPSNKYYDLYDYSTSNQQYQRGHLGDATKELGPFYQVQYNNSEIIRYSSSWFADQSYFIAAYAPSIVRGGDATNGSGAGISTFGVYYYEDGQDKAFRIVLAP